MVALSCSTLSADGFLDNDFALSFRALPEAGYRFVELNCWHPGNLVPAKIDELSGRCAAARLVPSAVYGSAFSGETTRDVNCVLWLMEAARRLGCGRVVLTGPDRSREDGRRRLGDALVALAPAAESLGMLICLENHFGNVLQGVDDYLRLFDRLDSAEVGVCADTGHFDAAGEDLIRVAEVLGRKIVHVHLKENRGSSGVAFVKFGCGTTAHHELIRRLLDAGYTGFLDIELSPTSEGLREGVPDIENLALARREFGVWERG